MKVKLYDLTQTTGIHTPPWPSYEPLQVKYFKRLSFHGANGQLITTSNHLGTHLDGQLHFVPNGRDIASLTLDELFGPAVIVDISDEVGEYEIYKPEHFTKKVEIKEGDMLVIHTGFHHYAWDQPEADEIKYFYKHPGPHKEFADWVLDMKIKMILVDCGSADHPMNTILRKFKPEIAAEAEKKLGRPLDEIFPPSMYQMMHLYLFPKGVLHVENVGGEIDKLLNKRVMLGVFPWKFEGGESAFCRVVAFEFEE